MPAGNATVVDTAPAARLQTGPSAERPSSQDPYYNNPQSSPVLYDARFELPSASNYKLMHTLQGHTACVASVRFQREGLLAASASGDNTAKLWDVESGKCVRTLDKHEDGLNDIVWSWNKSTVATASNDRDVRVWDSRSGDCVRKMEGHTSYVMSCSFSAAGDILASAGYDETIRLWCMHSGRLIRVIPAHSDPILCLDFSADLSKPVVASASSDGICRLWSTHSGECGRSIIPSTGVNTETPLLPVSFCKFTPNNKFLLLGTLAGRLQLWDFEPKAGNSGGLAPVSVKKTYVGHKNSRYALQASFMVNEPTGNKYVVSGSEDHHVFMWDLNQRSIVGILRGKPSADAPGDGHCDVVHSVDTNSVSPVIGSAGGAKDKTVKLWKYQPQG